MDTASLFTVHRIKNEVRLQMNDYEFYVYLRQGSLVFIIRLLTPLVEPVKFELATISTGRLL